MDTEGRDLIKDLRRAVNNRCEDVIKDLLDRLGRTIYITLVLAEIGKNVKDDDMRYFAECIVETPFYKDHMVMLPLMAMFSEMRKFYLLEEFLENVWSSYQERCDKYTLCHYGMRMVDALRLERKFLNRSRKRMSI